MQYTCFSGTTLPALATPGVSLSTRSGNLSLGTYKYLITYTGINGMIPTDVYGNTLHSSAAHITLTGPNSIVVTVQPFGVYYNSYDIYRTTVDGSTFYYLATITNPATTYSDGKADFQLDTNLTLPVINPSVELSQYTGYAKYSNPIIYSTVGATAAAGGGSTGAVVLQAQYNIVSQVLSDGDSVSLPPLNSNLVGIVINIVNKGSNTLAVFPSDSQTINGSIDSVSISPNTTGVFIFDAGSNWII